MTAGGRGDRFVRRPVPASSGRAVDESTILGVVSAPTTLLVSLSAIHLLMLGAATVVSVYKPWGETPFIRRKQRAT